jgi:hypothetical protein
VRRGRRVIIFLELARQWQNFGVVGRAVRMEVWRRTREPEEARRIGTRRGETGEEGQHAFYAGKRLRPCGLCLRESDSEGAQ